MNPLDAPLVARDVWLSTEDGSTPTDQSAAHFVLRMFDGYPGEEAILNAIAARLTRELSYRERDRARAAHTAALDAFRDEHPWMERLAERLWPGHWQWCTSQGIGPMSPNFWVQGSARTMGPSISIRHEGWEDVVDDGGGRDAPPRRVPGVFLSGMALHHHHMMLSAPTSAEMVARYRQWLATAIVHLRGQSSPVRPSPKSHAGRDLAAWMALEAEGAAEAKRIVTALIERASGTADVEKQTYSATPGMRNEYVDLVMAGLQPGREP